MLKRIELHIKEQLHPKLGAVVCCIHKSEKSDSTARNPFQGADSAPAYSQYLLSAGSSWGVGLAESAKPLVVWPRASIWSLSS